MIEVLQLIGAVADIGHAAADLHKQRKEEKERAAAEAKAKKDAKQGRK